MNSLRPSRLFSSLQTLIEQRLKQKLNPAELRIVNESWMHKKGSETHFKAVIVSDSFKGKLPVQRQRMVYKELTDVWSKGLHSLSVVAKTTQEWSTSEEVLESPSCRGNKA